QESGAKLSMPLPYQPNANAATDCRTRQLYITLNNAGAASVHFAIYPNAYRTDGPWQYDVAPNSSITNSFTVAGDGQYDFTCYGPIGFHRRFAGNVNYDCGQIETVSSIDTNAGSVMLALQNSTAVPLNFIVTDNFGLNVPLTNTVAPNTSETNIFFSAINNGWYDFVVTADGDFTFLRQLAGRIETGLPMLTVTNAPTIWIMPSATNSPPPIPENITNSPAIISLVSGLNLPPSTNPVTIINTTWNGNIVLIFPAWASNSAIEASTNLAPNSWTPVNASPKIMADSAVVPIPLTSANMFFRVRQ
ncbi:MAG: phospholipase domain-containing protein, partial [Limisphaerales bacterium]